MNLRIPNSNKPAPVLVSHSVVKKQDMDTIFGYVA